MTLIQDFAAKTEFSSYQDFYNNFSLSIPKDFNFSFDVVDVFAQKSPEQCALIWCNDYAEEKRITFLEMSELSKKIASYFTGLGLKKGDAVMLFLGRRWEYWPIILALHRIGAIGIPCTDHLHKNDILYRLTSLDVSMIICGTDEQIKKEVQKSLQTYTKQQPLLFEVAGNNDGWRNIFEESKSFDIDFSRPQGKNAVHNEDTMLIYFTSGTSGNPKMVKHSFTYPLSHIVTAKYWHQVTDGGIHYTTAETGWAKASWGQIYGQWICGSTVFVYDTKGFHPDSLVSKLSKYKVTSFCATPTIYRYLVRLNFEKYDLSHLMNCCSAGEIMSDDIYAGFLEKTGLHIHEGYGQTETALLAANFLGMESKNGSLGKPSPCFDIEIINKKGEPCKIGETGELVLNLKKSYPCGLFTGYYNNTEFPEDSFRNGFYYTKDLIHKDIDGYLWFDGRKDDIIKSAGFRISPFEVESILYLHPAVFECAVTGIEDSERGQALKASIVLAKGYEADKTLKNELFAFVKNETAAYKCPRVIEFVKELPKTVNGKIKHSNIQEDNKK